MHPERSHNPEAAAWKAPESAPPPSSCEHAHKLETKPIDEAERLSRDMAHTVTTKGWFKYWQHRLQGEEDLPDGVRQVVAGEKTGNQEDHDRWSRIFQTYVKARVANLSVEVPRGRDEAEAVAKLEAMATSVEATPSGKEKSAVELRAERQLQLRRDYKHSTSNKKWAEYWLPRLLELEDLSNRMREAIHDFNRSEQAKEKVRRYVDKLQAEATYELAKMDEMDRLHVELRRIDRGEPMEPREASRRRTVSYDEATGQLFCHRSRGKSVTVTEGDIVGDMMWGVKYRPDDSVPEAQWRRLRKLIAIRESASSIQDFNNRALAAAEGLEDLPTTCLSPELLEEHPQSGVVAERMVQSILLRLQHDHPEFGFRLEQSNALEDVVLKYDFKVVFTDRRRGVAMAGEEGRDAHVAEKRRLGMQFSVNADLDVIEHKEDQVEKANRDKNREDYQRFIDRAVSEIVLVVVPMKSVSAAFRAWLGNGKPPGGPEQFLDAIDRRTLIEGITAKIPGFDEKRVDEILEAMERD